MIVYLPAAQTAKLPPMQAAVSGPLVLQFDSGVSVSKTALYARAIARFEFVGLVEGEVAVVLADTGVVDNAEV